MSPREVLELEVQERPPSTLKNVDDGPPGGARAEDPGAPTINAKKRQWWTLGGAGAEDPGASTVDVPPSTLGNVDGGPREVPELKIRERPPSTLRNIDGRPPGGVRARGPRAPTINTKKHQR
jgi:hypothetical protein